MSLELIQAAARATAVRAEGWLFATLAGLAASALGWGVAQGLDFAERWDQFAALVRQMLS